MIYHALPWHSSIVVTPKTQSASVAQAGCHAFLLQIWFRHCIWASIDSLCSPFQPELTQRTDPAHHSSAFYNNLSVSVCVCVCQYFNSSRSHGIQFGIHRTSAVSLPSSRHWVCTHFVIFGPQWCIHSVWRWSESPGNAETRHRIPQDVIGLF